MTKYQIRRVTASTLLIVLGAVLLAIEVLRAILAPLWGMFSDFMSYLFA